HEGFLFFFLARHPDLVRVDHDNEIAGIDMWRENGLLFATQKPGRLDRDVAEHLIFGVDQPPLAVDLVGFGGKRLHQRLEKGTEERRVGKECRSRCTQGRYKKKEQGTEIGWGGVGREAEEV